MTEIVFDDVEHSFADIPVIRKVSLRLAERRIGIVGANGSGKSTLVRMINGLVLPDRGCIRVNGLNVARQGRQVRTQVGFVFTDPDSQIVMPTVREDVAFSLRRLRLPADEATRRVDTALERFGLTTLADHSAHRLSGGQKQLLALAAILVTEPTIVVADEPTTLLDARNTKRVMSYLAELEQQLIVVTHQLHLLADFDRVIVMENGHVVADAPPAQALRHYRELVG